MGKEITDRDILNQMIDRGVKNIIECYYPQFSFLSGYASNLLMDFIDPYLEVLTNGGSFNTSIAKAYHLTYASSVVVAYSLNPIMYLQETKELTDFVKRFHSNSIIPSNLDTAASTLGIESLMELPEEEFNAVLESVKIDDSFTPDELTALGR